MTTASGGETGVRRDRSGWLEGLLFAVMLAVLNISYAVGREIGAHPVAFLAWAMPAAALTLLAFSGAGPHWRAIAVHPLSFVVGGGIIGMEAFYYMVIQYVTPTDGSVLVRLGLPLGMLIGFLAFDRRPTRIATIGGIIVLVSILLYVPAIEAHGRWIGLGLGSACAFIMSARAFATELHPWNREAKTVVEKMRVTGIVLLVSTLIGLAFLGAAMALAASGAIAAPAWMPEPAAMLHGPTILLSVFIGGLVITSFQYLGFSAIVKIGTENYLALTALIPIITLAFQIISVEIGLLGPVAFDWRALPVMAAVMAGVMLIIWGGRKPAE